MGVNHSPFWPPANMYGVELERVELVPTAPDVDDCSVVEWLRDIWALTYPQGATEIERARIIKNGIARIFDLGRKWGFTCEAVFGGQPKTHQFERSVLGVAIVVQLLERPFLE